MAMEPDVITAHIMKAFPDAEMTLEDLAGDGDHFSLTVRSNFFLGKTKVQQHQMVYKALGDKVGRELHALALQTGPLPF